ncbi:exonuclease domain-containing protein [Rhodopirellula sp. MGV]|uniref:exonuclease domain-containing protein n=1 Tax=Rhodopirellula sp. MGV TaxID=2023130 RepID=UPI000B976DE7|nr:exonuclease domain-containing protein [Rhodopirellula sp. MGV]OYP38516.1 hypothetical protein CGZ80_01850 [Rhodopirellula sp. MGV]PNY34840.1 DNA polymerase III subunit epsilon [Rhodopirellula baltica]
MAFQANFTAIDFETANRRQDSACQLAAVVVRDGKIVREGMWMIRPEPFFFSAININIHGIHPDDVRDEPNFGGLWGEISEFIADDCLIAHNAMFDIGVLKACLEKHQCDIPSQTFSCTRLISRHTWPDRQRYGLKPLSTWLGIDFKHHDALEDSRACARLLLAAGATLGVESMDELEQKLRLSRGKYGDWGIKNAKRVDGRRPGKPKASNKRSLPKGAASRNLRRGTVRPLRFPMDPFDEQSMVRESGGTHQSSLASGDGDVDWQRVAIRCEFIQPLRGRIISFVGQLRVITNEQAIELARRAGGQPQDKPDAATNCVVVAAPDKYRPDVPAAGQVEVLSEADFLKRLGV